MKRFFLISEVFRSFRKNLSTGILSLAGLSIGMAVALLIGFWSLNEFSFDKFHKDADKIYRICRKGFLNNETVTLGAEFGPAAIAAKEELPEVEDYTRVSPFLRELVKVNDVIAYEQHVIACDKNLFQFFSFKLEIGDAQTCFDAPDKMVIDRHIADKYFKGENPIGKMFQVFGQEFQISAVMENIPENSHLKFHIAVTYDALSWINDKTWGNNDNVLSYLKIKEGSDIESLGKRISQITYKHFPIYEQYQITHFLQPLKDIHFSTGFRFDSVITNDRRMVFIFITIALLILSIACFNFINLFISTSFQRAKAIGIKKINGISVTGLFLNSFAETAMYIGAATLVAFVIAIAALPFFNQLTGGNLSLDFGNYRIYLFTGGLMLVTLLAAGIFPVFYILKFNPQEIIKSKFKGGGITVLQRVLVVSQFAASIILIASSVIIKKQLNFIQNKDLGFNTEQIIWFQPRNIAESYETFRQEAMRNPNIKDVTIKTCLPNDWNNGNPVVTDENPNAQVLAEVTQVGYNYIDMMNIPLLEGSNPFFETSLNSDQCLINEKTVKALELTNPIGKQITLIDNRKVTVAGILKDINTKSLHIEVDPQIYVKLEHNDLRAWHFVMVKTASDPAEVIKILTESWQKYNPSIPFEYSFLDDTYNQLYQAEATASKTVSVGMGIALFLAFMGLFAMAHYATEKRVKEIGVRKVNGATISEILVLLNKDFVKWVVLAFLIASPIALYAMYKWLGNFAYKTELSWWVFVLAGMLSMMIALITVSWQSWRAAARNPVEALRYE